MHARVESHSDDDIWRLSYTDAAFNQLLEPTSGVWFSLGPALVGVSKSIQAL